ncbi:response regulator, partial [Streptococcus pneumoniae GA16531]
VIQKIIGLSLENVSGLLGIDGGFFSNLKEKIVNSDDVTSGVNVEVGKTQVAVDLNVIVEYQKMFQLYIQKSEKSYLQKLLK